MIVLRGPALFAAEAAARLAVVGGVSWVKSPSAEVERSFVACAPVQVVSGAEPEDLQRAWLEHQRRWAPAPPLCPVAVGFLAYEYGKPLVGGAYAAQVPSGWSSMQFRFYDAVFEVSHTTRVLAVDEAAAQRLLQRLQHEPAQGDDGLLGSLSAAEPDELFVEGVARVQEYLRAGDTYQVNLARRLVSPLAHQGTLTGLSLAAQLEQHTPAPYGIWYGPADGDARALVGNSPECFLRITVDGAIETSPIKGTRPRSPERDEHVIKELATSEKDRAEHDMIVDLERNDLGRICMTGSVRVLEHARVMHLPTVHHLVSTVRGQLVQPSPSLREILTATFPGGSITGAPKRRAMEIIAELESHERGPYTGATGWLGAAGDLELAVAIRTAALSDNRLVLWVGGGIVVDSDADAELAETNAKAQAFTRLWSP